MNIGIILEKSTIFTNLASYYALFYGITGQQFIDSVIELTRCNVLGLH